MKHVEKFHLNELNEEQVNIIVDEFFNRVNRSLTIGFWEKLGGTWMMRDTFKELKRILRNLLANIEDGENTRNFAIRYIRIMKKRILTINVVQKLGGTYYMNYYWKQWRIILTELLDREMNLNEEFRFDKPAGYTKDFIKGLLAKVKTIIPQEKIDKFIEENKEQVKQVADMLSDENGEIDYDKTKDFIKKKVKNV